MLCAALLVFAARSGEGQSALTHTEDATPIVRGALRFSVTNGWSRYESRFGESGSVGALGDEFSTDSLGPRQLPRLAPVEGALRTLARNAGQRISFGRLAVQSDARIVTTPFAFEYGVSRRLSFGVVVPLVQTRRSAQVRVNTRVAPDTAKTSNVGFIPASSRQSAATGNASLVAALTAAAGSVTGLLSRCQQNASAAECDVVRGREVEATEAARRAAEFAAAVRAAYGVTEQTVLVAPLSGSQLAKEIEAQRAALAAQLATFAPGTTLGTLFNASTEFSYADFQGRNGVPGLLQSELGGGLDSIATTERIGFGDIELRARFLVLDRVQRDTLPARGVQYRLAVGGSFRFATSRPDTARNLLDIGTGEGGGAEVRSALDITRGRVGATVAARYAKSFARTVEVPLIGFPTAGFPNPSFGTVSRTAGDVLGIDITPRVFLGEWLAFEGQYGLERTGAPSFTDVAIEPCPFCGTLPGSVLPAALSVQRAGFGVRYSTVDSFLRGRARYPIEVSYRHLETVTGDAGAPKLFRDQIGMRIFLGARQRNR